VLAVFDGFQGHPGPKLDLPGSFDNCIHIPGLAQEHGIIGNAELTVFDAIF
jgi:hypothetical protein